MHQHIRSIGSKKMTVKVNLFGASLWSIKDNDNVEYLWQGDEKYWGDRAPVLFPYIARLTNGEYLLNGKKYQMDIHGFAKDSLFEVKRHTESELVLFISDSEESFSQYPYHFLFEISYRIENDRLDISFCVQNKDTHTMYFAVGGHPGFNVPIHKGERFEDYYLEFVGEGYARQELFSEDCYWLGKSTIFTLMEGNCLPLTHGLFDDDAVVLSDMPRTVQLKSKHGGKIIQVRYPQMNYLGIWHCPKSDAPYVCIEPWSSLPSRNKVTEDISMQNNLIKLIAGESYVNNWSIEISCE